MASSSTTPAGITPSTFLSVLSRYEAVIRLPGVVSLASTVTQKTLGELDAWRVNTLPTVLSQRGKDGRSYLTHEELQEIMKCKMKRGKFRPTLLPLVTSNSTSAVEKVTEEAFSHLKGFKHNEKPSIDAIKTALNYLSKSLKGVGPATASYLLAAQSPQWIPAFSDEAFRWVFIEDSKPGVIKGSRGDGWTRKMDYSLKEYIAFVEKVWEIRKRLIQENSKHCGLDKKEKSEEEMFNAGTIEMVGWVLGKEASGWTVSKAETSGDVGTREQSSVEAGKRKRGDHEFQESGDIKALDAEDTETSGSKGPRVSRSRKLAKEKFLSTSNSPTMAQGQAGPTFTLRRSARSIQRSPTKFKH
ncbi:hypothetical protein BDZ91DRAFT_760069 [Kalaharituber pfeilii]|nr:hypothetical protein BDZ91DRAFT_760069 [Kalaharituber pfeilii]